MPTGASLLTGESMRWEQQVQYAFLSDIGFRRRNNEDSCRVHICSEKDEWTKHGHLFIVADGMGGHAVGELASKLAADTVPHSFFKSTLKDVPQSLKQAVENANATINERGSQNHDFARMGTTCTSMVLCSRGAVFGHVGDSRAYRIRRDRIDQLTFDHSLQWEMMRQGNVRPDDVLLKESRHVITRSLGPEPTVQVDVEGPYAVLPDDVYVLCSDGLTGHLQDDEIGAIASSLPPGEACRLLVNLANLRGGSDNVTAIVARVGDLPAGAAPIESDDPADYRGAGDWVWLAGFWAVAAAFIGGVALALMRDEHAAGIALVGTAIVALVLMLYFAAKNRPPRTALNAEDAAKTTMWRPYRSASAELTKEFVTHLAAVESQLQRTASDEGWDIDWNKHAEVFRNAGTLASSGRYPEAFAGFAKSIEILMTGVTEHRRKRNRKAKWGKTTTSNSADSA